MRRLAQSTSVVIMLKVFLSNDHITAATGKTVAITISKNGGAFGNPNAGATNATEVSGGWYKVTMDTTDTGTLGDLAIVGTATSCDISDQICHVVSATTNGATNLDAAITSRMATYTQPTGFLAATFPTTVASTTNITAGTVTTTTNVTTVNGLAAGVVTATSIADDAITAAKVANGAIDAATFASGALDAVWSTATRLLTAGTNIVLAKGTGVTGFNDIAAGAAMTLTAAYDAAKTAATQTSVDDLPTNAELATALGTADDAVLAAIAALNNLSQANIRSAVGLGSANLDTQLDALPTNAELATALGTADDAVLAAIAALNNLSAAQVNAEADTALADVGVTLTVTGRIDAAVTTRASQTSVDAIDDFVDTEVAAIKLKTDLIPAAPAAVGDIPTAVQNADALLNRDLSTGTDSGSATVRTLRQAVRFLRNKWAVSAGTLTVYKEDDSTASWTGTVATDAAADPIVSNDPASS